MAITRVPGRSYAVYVQGFSNIEEGDDAERPVLFLTPVEIARFTDAQLVESINELLSEKGSQMRVDSTNELVWAESTQADGTIVMTTRLIARAQTKGWE